MTIDLRYVIVAIMFFMPTLTLKLLASIWGYSMPPDTGLFLGSMFGACFVVLGCLAFFDEGKPIPFRIFKGKGE